MPALTGYFADIQAEVADGHAGIVTGPSSGPSSAAIIRKSVVEWQFNSLRPHSQLGSIERSSIGYSSGRQTGRAFIVMYGVRTTITIIWMPDMKRGKRTRGQSTPPKAVPSTTSNARWLPRARLTISKLLKRPTRSEDDLISKVVLPFFKILGYDDRSYELKYPVEGYLPHRPGRKPEADVVFFIADEHSVKSSLIVTEVKKNGQPIAEQQARFYATNLFVPYYVAWSGYAFEVWQLSNYRPPTLLGQYDLSSASDTDISVLRGVLAPNNASAFCAQNDIKHLSTDEQLQVTAAKYRSGLIADLSQFKSFVLPIVRDLNLQYVPLRISEVASVASPILNATLDDDPRAISLDGSRASYGLQHDLGYLASEIPAIVVLGHPGAGKSTLLRKLCIEVAEEGQRLPIYLSVHELASLLESPIEGALRQIRQYANTATPEALFETAIEQGRLLLCLDGIDELDLTNPQDARQAVRRIGSSLSQLLSRDGRNRVVVSVRNESWPACRPLLPHQFQEFEIHPFRRQDARAFIRRWFGASNSDSDIVIEALRGRGWPAFARNPLLLTLICATFDRTSGLPKTLSELFERFLRRLVHDWNATWRISRYQPVDKLTFERISTLLSGLALRAHERHLTSFTRALVEEVFSLNLAQAGLATESVEEVQAQIVEQYGLLRSWSIDGHFAFPHLSFQAYFVARALRLQSDGHRLLLKKRDDPFWQEAILLYAEQGDVAKLAEGLLAVKDNIISSNTFLAAECWITSGTLSNESVGHRLVARLAKLTKGAPSFLSEKAQRLLARLPSPHARRLIEKTLRDASGKLRSDSPATSFVVEMFGEQAIDEIVETLKNEGSSDILMGNFESLAPAQALRTLSALIKEKTWPAEVRRGSDAGVRHIRRQAAHLMAAIGEEDALRPLVALLNAPQLTSFERTGIVTAISEIDDDAVRPTLEDILKHSEDVACRIEAAGRLAPKHSDAKHFLLAFVAADEEDFFRRRDAASELANFELSDDEIEPLRGMLFDPCPEFWGGPASAAHAVAARGSDRARSLLEEAHQYWLKSRYPQADPIRSAIALDLARIDESRDPREQLLLANDPAPRNIDWNLPDLAREYYARAPKEATNLFVEALQGYEEENVWVSKLPWAIIRILPEVTLTDDLVGAAIGLARRTRKDGFVWYTISALWNRTDLSSSQRRMFYAS